MIFCLNVLNGGTNNSSALGKCCFNIPLPLENDLNPSKPCDFPIPLLFDPPKGRFVL